MPKHAKLRERSFKHSTSFTVEAVQDIDHALLASESPLQESIQITLCMTPHVTAARNYRQTTLGMLVLFLATIMDFSSWKMRQSCTI